MGKDTTTGSVRDLLSAGHMAGVRLWVDNGELRYRSLDGALSPEALGELRSRKAEIIAYLERGTESGGRALPPFVAQPHGAVVPLSHGQERLWSWASRAAAVGLNGFHGHLAIRLRGPLDLAILQRSVTALAGRHETLRMRLRTAAGRPVQVIQESGELPLPVIDLREVPQGRRKRQARQAARDVLCQPVSSTDAPTFRIAVLQLSADDHVLVAWLHPIVADAWSRWVLRRELGQIYAALSGGQSPSLPPLPVQFPDYVLWKRRSMDAIARLHLDFWRSHLSAAPPLRLPADRSPQGVDSALGRFVPFALPRDLVTRVVALGRRERATSFVVLFAAFAAILSRWSRQDDVVVGLVGGRGMAELQSVIGYCANYAPIRVDLAGDPSVRELIRRVKVTSTEASDHYYPHIENLPELLRPAEPFCRVQFHVNPSPADGVGGSHEAWFGSGIAAIEFPVNLRHYSLPEDLIMTVYEGRDWLTGHVLYRPDLFRRATIKRFVADYRRCLEAMVAGGGQPVSALPGD